MPVPLPENTELDHGNYAVDDVNRLPHEAWLPVLQRSCGFPPDVFDSVCLNLIKNPNINSSLLFRADVLYDSDPDASADSTLSEVERDEALQKYNLFDGELSGFEIRRTIIRRMIPRNPQLDKPIAQTCLFLKSVAGPDYLEQTVTVYLPHAPDVGAIPWYHPRVQAVAYLHSWRPSTTAPVNAQGTVSLHYRLFPSESLPLSSRLFRTGQQLLTTIVKHGQGQLAGYKKRVHHDQLISQSRVQDRYTDLKEKHAKRLCDRWVEKTEPSKHVFEDLGIAAFLIELWKEIYDGQGDRTITEDRKFPGFVDIGCGNGVLVDILLREGYRGWGFDARKRKTWGTFDDSIRGNVKELILVPEPLLEMQPASEVVGHAHGHANGGIISNGGFSPPEKGNHLGGQLSWHNGIFPTGTFIISNHADELTAWTPLLASISSSPFLAIPCCSHNLSGARFRAPSVFNNNSADVLAPSYFSAQINKNKSVAIAIACSDNEVVFGQEPEQGNLKDLNPKSRAKQPSAYSSLCDWVAHLAARVGYKVEREMLRLPSTRNVGIVGQTWMSGFADRSLDERREMVNEIAHSENANGTLWMQRARGLTSGSTCEH
ncbi:tRNA(Ser) Um(44) 2'-O-methyltransferase [Lecanora helva]